MFLATRLTEEESNLIETLSSEEKKKLRKNCVSAILVLGQNKAPIKRAELNKIAFTHANYRMNRALLIAANHDLSKKFGMRLYEDDKRLLLVNTSTKFSSYANRSEASDRESSILFFILMDLFTSPDENLSEQDIQRTISSLDLTKEEFKGYIDSFVKKLYLTVTKDAAQADGKLYSWGPRAIAEVNPDKFFDCFLTLVDTGTEKDWPEIKARVDKLKAVPNR